MPMADHADSTSSLGFLSCTMNATNQFLHPCICAALFHDPADPEASDRDGTIPWDAAKQKTPLPRFYADGASKSEAGRLIVAVAAAEMYPLIDCLDKSLAPAGMSPVTRMHGGEPVGHFFMQELGNGPEALGRRSGLTDMAMTKLILEEDGEEADADVAADDSASSSMGLHVDPAARSRKTHVNYKRFFEWAMSYGLSHNTRLGSVLSPAVVLPNDDPNDAITRRIKPNVNTRFFTDDVPNGLCIVLGLAELFGYDLERDMSETLGLVRRLQRWMGKEYVVPANGGGASSDNGNGGRRKVRMVADARDLAETSAPQAFGVRTVRELRNFLAMSPFAEDVQGRMEGRVGASPLVSRL
uniref:Uncharacterized protein n=1 Tax=Odontella aurita TaxID=265563 RepID=A0A7S4MVA9_9STRA